MWPTSSQVFANKAEDSRYCNAFLILWSVINILPLSVCIILICVYNEPILDAVSGFGRFSATSMGGIVLVTHLVILLESLFTRNGQNCLWIKAKSVDRTFEKMGIATDQHRKTFYRRFSVKFFSYQLIAWISEITVLILIDNNKSWKLFNSATLFSVMVSRSRHLHHALYIGECHVDCFAQTQTMVTLQTSYRLTDLLTADFRAIKEQLETVVEKTKSTEDNISNPKNDIKTMDQIKLAKTAYSLLYEMSIQLNGVVSLSQLLNLTQGFIYLTSDLHSLYVKLYLNDFAALLGQ